VLGTVLVALALASEAVAPSLWAFAVGMMLFGLGFGMMDAALNAHAAGHFGARQINWMHASYGLGATIGPLLVTVILGYGLGWRWTYGIMAALLVAFGLVLARGRRGWEGPTGLPAQPYAPTQPAHTIAVGTTGRRRRTAIVIGALAFTAIETGVESGAGIWGYLFLTGGRGLPPEIAGVAVSAYWAMMFLGRAVLGPVAERLGASRVLGAAVAGIAFGAALMSAPAPGAVAVIGMMVVGLAAAPVFPLFTLTTGGRVGAEVMTRTVTLQVAASAVGGFALPGLIGVAIAGDAGALAPFLLCLSTAMGFVYWFLSRTSD
jgi:fucose permease